MANSVILKGRGLNTNDNELDLPQGSLVEADNVNIDELGIVTARRGFKIYKEDLANSAKQLFSYKERLIIHSGTSLFWDNGSGTFTGFTGTFTEPTSNIRMKSVKAQGNLYFCTDVGVKKLSLLSSSDYSTESISNAGGILALDLTAIPNYTGSGFLTTNSKVSYRVVWGIKDKNNNIILGSPSNSFSVENTSTTSTCYTTLTITVPADVTTNHFYQIYRSSVVQASGSLTLSDIANSDDHYLVAENFSLSSEITSGSITVDDVLTEDLRATGTPLYTSATIGDGIIASNYPPPRAQDIALYKDFTFYANTRSRHINFNNILSVNGFEHGRSQIWVASGSSAQTFNKYTFTGLTETSKIVTVGDTANSLDGRYFLINSANDTRRYFVWFNTSGGSATQPSSSDTIGRIPIEVAITTGDGANNVASALSSKFNTSPYSTDFSASVSTNNVTVSHLYNGSVTTVAEGATATGFTFSVLYDGVGSSASNKEPLLSNLLTVSQKIFESSSSFSSVVNKNTSENIISLYESSPTSLPGSFTFQSKTLDDNAFYIGFLNDDMAIGDNFNPSYPVITQIGSASIASSSVITMPQVPVISTAIDVTNNVLSCYLGDGTLQAKTDVSSGSVDTGTDIFTASSHGLSALQEVMYFNQTGTNLVGMKTGSVAAASISTTTGKLTFSSGHSFVNRDVVRFTPSSTLPRFVSATSASAAGDGTITVSGTHTFRAGDVIVFESGGGLPAEITSGREYFVKTPTSTTYQISNTPNGSTITLTGGAFTTIASISQFYVVSVANDGFYLTRNPGGTVLIPSNAGTGTHVINQSVFFVNKIDANTFKLSIKRSLADTVNITSAGTGTHSFYPVLPLIKNQPIKISTSGSLPSGLSSTSVYYVQNLALFNFQLSTEQNGTITSLGSQGSGTHTVKVLHGYSNSSTVVISDSNSTPTINGNRVITTIDDFSFSIPVTTTGAATFARVFLGNNVSTNESNPNRLYFSKPQQPEAVPLQQYFIFGSKDNTIQRIMPTQSALYVFTDEGIFKLAGETSASFFRTQIDSAKLLVPDSVAIVNSAIYGLFSQGVCSVSDSGVRIESRDIENALNPLSTTGYSSLFKSTTFGVAYELDRSYLLWIPNSTTNADNNVCYRYNTITQSWTKWPIAKRCGIVHSDNKLYLGASDINAVEQERKAYDRTDYVDREYATNLVEGSKSSTTDENNESLTLTQFSVTDDTNISVGDVLIQTVYLTVTKFNGLLTKLDDDSQIAAASTISGSWTLISGTTYEITTSAAHKFVTGDKVLVVNGGASVNATYTVTVMSASVFRITVGFAVTATGGTAKFKWNTSLALSSVSNLTTGMTNLVAKLNIFDTSTVYVFSGTTVFSTIQTEYNVIIGQLNVSSGINQSDFTESSGSTELECIVHSIPSDNVLTTIHLPNIFVGSLTILKGINSKITFAPLTLGDPSVLKHFSMGTIIFDRTVIKEATISVRSDISFGFKDINYVGNITQWGVSPWGEFPWSSSGATSPRFIIPKEKQRARYIYFKFEHNTARIGYKLLGLSVTYNPQSVSPIAHTRGL